MVYKKTETRTGPPLSYISEKLRLCVIQSHRIYKEINSIIALHYALISYCALWDMLELIGTEVEKRRIYDMSSAELKRWLDHIESEGQLSQDT